MKARGAVIVFCALWFLCGCGGRTKRTARPAETIEFFALNTRVSLSAYGDNAAEALQAARQVIEQCEEKWSVTNTRSELYAINHGGGIRRTISGETARLIAYALDMARKTDGVFDPTVYPVVRAWGFTTDEYGVPSDERMSSVLPLVGYEKILLDGNDITVPDGMQLDLGAVAKGYIGDLVIDCLRGYGIESAIVNLGGNVQLIGRKDDGTDWNIGVRSPFGDGAFASVRLDGQAIITSGGYQRNFTGEDGNVYHHIMNPRTGRPADSGLASVSIIAADGKYCDALSTAFFVMGAEKAIAFWRGQGGFDMILVTDGREVIITETIADRFALTEASDEWKVTVIQSDGGKNND